MITKKELEKYVVHLKFEENNGSGVILKPFKDSNYCYIFTAKHTFKTKNRYGEDIFISPLNSLSNFEIITPLFSQFQIESWVELDEINDIDLLILCVKNQNFSFWDDIEVLKIFSGEFDRKMTFTIGGFPAIHNHHSLEDYECYFSYEDNSNYLISVESTKTLSTYEINELETNRGISGGGLFVEGNDSQIYLVGIEVEYEHLQKLKCIDLREIIDVINETIIAKSLDKIEIGGYPILDEYGLINKKFDLSIIEDELLNNYIKEVKDKPIEFIKDKSNEINIDLEKRYKKLLHEMKDIANSYLYRGAVFNGKYNLLATNSFKRAIRLNKDLEIYLERARYIRNNENYKQIDKKSKRDNKFSIDILKGKIEEEKDNKNLIKLYIDLLFYLQHYEDYYADDIKKYTRMLVDLYVRYLNFKEAERILENPDLNKVLDRIYVKETLFKIYFHSAYLSETKLSKKEFSDKLISLIGIFDFESKEYFLIREKLKQLNIFDDYIFTLSEKFIKSERNFEKYEQNIALLSEEIVSMKKETSDNHKDNRSLHFTIYVILISLLIIFNNNEILKGINFIFNYIQDFWNSF